MSGRTDTERNFLLVGGFLGGLGGGCWFGLMLALVSGTLPSDPPLFPGEYPAVAMLVIAILAVLSVIVRRADRDGRRSALGLLFTASFASLNTLYALYFLAPPEILCILPPPGPAETATEPYQELAASQSLPHGCHPAPSLTASPALWAAMSPALVVAALLCLAAVRRNSLLQLVGLVAGGLFTLTGLLLALARALP